MSMATRKIMGFLLMGLVLCACTPDTAVPATIPPTRTSAATPSVMVTAVAQSPPTETATNIPTPTPTETSTPTKTPHPTVTPTPTSTPEFYDLPAWVSDPMANVLLIETADRRGRHVAVTLFNAQTGERFDIPVTGNVTPRWVQTENDLYINLGYPISSGSSTFSSHEIHVGTGQVIQTERSSQIVDGTKYYPSPDGRFKVAVVEVEDIPKNVMLVNEETGTEVELIDPFSGEYADRLEVGWSPDGQIIAVERYRFVEDPTDFYGVKAVPALAIFSLQGTLLAQYQDLISMSFKWSPTLPYRFLYPAYTLNNEPPCILDVLTGEYDCIEAVAQWRDEQGVEIGIFEWSPDSSKIGFAYWGETSGFCYVELATNIIACPVTRDDLQVEEYLERFAMGDGIAYLYIVDHWWSPDGEYIALQINAYPPSSDDGGLATAVIAQISGENLQVIGDGKLLIHDPWRPPIEE